jgi:hypothetical protein
VGSAAVPGSKVALIIGAWGRVGRLGSSRAISISVRAHSAPYASEFLFVENADESKTSATFRRTDITVFRAGF